MFELNNFDKIKIGIASPEKIREWSYGEVTKPETINYRTQKPEKDGLFCEKIFGPSKDYECHCGRYKRIRFAGVICDKCGVEVTKSKVRRERMGHIELAAPVSHIWYFRGIPSKIGQVLSIPTKQLEQVLYFASYIVLDPGTTDLKVKQVLTDSEYTQYCANYGKDAFKVGMGAEAIRELLCAIDLEKEIAEIKDVINGAKSNQVKQKELKKLEILESFLVNNQRPEWMILTVLPVIPPELRPMVQLEGGRFATSDLNDLYRRVIMRNNRLKKLMEQNAPEIMIRNEKRMLQEAVDTLIDNGKRGKPAVGPGGRDLKSLSAYLRGKQGRFRMNLLGKRVDYSGRSVIVVGPELKIHQCGLPKEMAIELFKPFVMRKLVEGGYCQNIKSAKRTVERMKPVVWNLLEEVIKDHPVLLNRAPTLHRLSIQAFEPVLIEGRAIKLHPLVCAAFNADFDGDQMAVHVPLSIEAQAEARFLMLSSNNVLKLSDGKPVMSPSQDMVLGCYYLTIIRKAEGRYYAKDAYYEYFEEDGRFFKEDEKKSRKEGQDLAEIYEEFEPSNIVRNSIGKISSCTLKSLTSGKVEEVTLYTPKLYLSENEVLIAYQTKQLHMEDEIYVRRSVVLPDDMEVPADAKGTVTINADGKRVYSGRIKTTCGRIIFNQEIPQDLGIQKRETPDDLLKFEINSLIGKKHLKNIVQVCFNKKSAKCAVDTLDYIKSLGYKYSTIGAITTSIFDMNVPKAKPQIIEDSNKEVVEIEKLFNKGFITEDERYRFIVSVWQKATDKVASELEKTLDKFNPIWMMANSGARGDNDQIKQLSGMRGLVSNPNGKTIETPVKSNFREGLTVLEYFISSHGGRKGLTDTALKTADSGYLTRRLVDVSHSVIVREEDCANGRRPEGREVSAIRVKGVDKPVEGLADRINGRFTIDPIVNPSTGEVIVPADTMISMEQAEAIEAAGIEKVLIRSVFSCGCRNGVCVKCYGRNMSNLSPVQVGEAVGTIAAQSIGEPGTQLTMRTFHTGGIATATDITLGLPRVEELFEARRPAGQAVVSEISGVVEVLTEDKTKDGLKHIIVRMDDKDKKEYAIPFRSEILVKTGDVVATGDVLTSGSVFPQDILRTVGNKKVEEYILTEVQKVYRSQNVEINDKHIEIIVKQMLRKLLIQEAGDTNLLPGDLVELSTFKDANREAIENGKEPAEAQRVLLGITKAALATDSFLSAASFQETTKVLTDAAIKGKVDNLLGLKENIIIGKLIPAGTGLKEYRNLSPIVNRVENTNYDSQSLFDKDEESEEAISVEDEFVDLDVEKLAEEFEDKDEILV